MAEDSIEHYAFCPVVQSVAVKYMGLQEHVPLGLRRFMLCDPRVKDPETLASTAVVIYAAYCATNQLRIRPVTSTKAAEDCLQQLCKAGLAGHGRDLDP